MLEGKSAELENLLVSAWPGLSPSQRTNVVRFYEMLLAENEIQNLTRLTSPREFLEGHVLDVKEMLASGLVKFPAMDLGSGGGVPGLLAAIIHDEKWILADSEGRKAAFLTATAEKLGLANVQVFSGRGEEFLKKGSVESVVARAVGPVDRIYAWLRPCSTWNNLVLLKGPGWDVEWKTFQESKHRKELQVQSEYRYQVGEPPKSLRIIRVDRANVPRGTK